MRATVRVGVETYYTDLYPVGVTELASALEARGFDSLHLGEHTHIPVGEMSDIHRGTIDLDVALKQVARLGDPFVLLSAAAAVTTRLRLGTSVCLVAEYEPIGLAHLVGTLDWMSGGRVELGIGYGWNRPEMENRGLDWRRRRAILREKVLAMQAIWENDIAAFDGEHVSFTRSWSWPKPVQHPLPVLLGVVRSRSFDQLVEFCTGWMPNVRGLTDEEFLARRDELFALAEAAGRDPATLGMTISQIYCRAKGRPPRVVGEIALEDFKAIAPTRADVDYYAALGADSALVQLPAVRPQEFEPLLDFLAAELLG